MATPTVPHPPPMPPSEHPLSVGMGPAFAALVVSVLAMGLSPIFVRLAEVGPFASAFWRVFLALPVLYAWMRLSERGTTEASRPVLSPAILLAGLAFAGDLFFWHLAIRDTTVANATFFATTAPVFVILIVALVFREPVPGMTWLGLGACLLGGAALIGQSVSVDPARLVGDLYGVATALFFALYFLAIGRARTLAGPARVTFLSTIVTAIVLAFVAWLLEPRLLPASWRGGLAILAMALISHAAGQGLLAVALGRLPPVFSSLVIFLEALTAAILGWLVLHEAVTPVQMLGGGLILAGIWLARPRAARDDAESAL